MTAPSAKETEKKINKLSDKGEAKNSSFGLLRAKAKKIGKNYITLSWTGVKGTKSYIIYGNQCGTKYKYKKIATLSGKKRSFKVNKLADKKTKVKKGTFYKFIVVAVSGSNKAIATSKSIHLITLGNKRICNFKSVKIMGKTSLTLKKGKTAKIKAKQIKASSKLKVSQHRKLAYESSAPTVASVSKTGKIKAKAKGRAKIYVYAQNGIFKIITVTVK